MSVLRKLDTLDAESMGANTQSNDAAENGYRSFSEEAVAEKFGVFLRREKGRASVSVHEIPELLSEFLKAKVPEIGAVAFLRNDFHRPALASNAPPYQGLAKDGPALSYVQTHYKADISNATLTTAALRQADPKLFGAVDAELRKPGTVVRKPVVISTLGLRDQRREGLGTILGTDRDAATRYALGFQDRRIPDKGGVDRSPSR